MGNLRELLVESRALLAGIGGQTVIDLNAAYAYAVASNNLAFELRGEDKRAEREALWREAIEIYEKILHRRPNDTAAARSRGVSQGNLAREIRARFAYEEELELRRRSVQSFAYAIRIDPGNLRVWEDHIFAQLSLAGALRDRGRISEHNEILRLISINPISTFPLVIARSAATKQSSWIAAVAKAPSQ